MRMTKKINLIKICLILFSLLFTSLSSVSFVSATHVLNATLENGTQRIVPTGTTATLTLMVNNTADSIHTITGVNITNSTASGYFISAITPPTGWTCSVGTVSNCINASTTGIAVNSYATFNMVVTTPGSANSGVTTWSINTTDTNVGLNNNTVKLLALDQKDIGFDVRDELGNVLTSTNVTIYGGGGLGITVNNITDGSGVNDAAADGLVIFDAGATGSDEISGSSTDGFYGYSISRAGFVTGVNSSVLNYLDGTGDSGFNPTKVNIQYLIKITVQDELANALTGATVNVTDISSAINSTILPNKTFANNYYFALPNGTLFDNVTFIISKSGFLTNGSANASIAGTFYLINVTNQTFQVTGGSPYLLKYSLKVTVQNELNGIANMSSVTLHLNDTKTTPDASSANVYYFNKSTDTNVTANKTGYVNATITPIKINTSTQAAVTTKLPFTLKIITQDELLSNLTASSATYVTNLTTTQTVTNTTGGYAYFVLDPSNGNLNVTGSYTGYVNNSAANLLINGSAQAAGNTTLPFTVKVTDIWDELNITKFGITGTDAFTEVLGSTTTYSGGAAYIPTANGLTVSVVAGRNSFINASKQITASSGQQTVLVFNKSSDTGNATALSYTFKVLGVWNELGNLSFILDGTKNNAAIEVNYSGNTAYSGGYAYLNVSGTNASVTAYKVGKDFVNMSQNVTPSALTQQTILFNISNGLSANVFAGGLKYLLKVNVTDELSGISNMDSGMSFAFNFSAYTPNATVGNVYYFTNNTGATPTTVNITGLRAGYVNATNTLIRLNASAQAFTTIQLPFTLKVGINNELTTPLTASSVAEYRVNNTVVNPNATSDVYAYFAYPPQDMYVNVSYTGYVNSTTSALPLNGSAQALQNTSLPFTLKVTEIFDELNITKFTIDGSPTTVGSAFAEVLGSTTTYSGGAAYIPTPNGLTVSVVAGASGFVNESTSVIASSAAQKLIVFNQSGADSYQNATDGGLNFTVKVLNICDEVNRMCFTIDSTPATIGHAGVQNTTGGVNTTYVGGYAYLNASGTGIANITAFSTGFINRSQLVTLTPGTVQQVIWFNSSSTYPLLYALKVNVTDELGQSTGMNTSAALAVNSTWKTENAQFWRSATTSNIYYFNLSTAAYNLTGAKVGYINTTYGGIAGFLVNATKQAVQTVQLPYVVKVTVRASNNELLNGSQLTINDGSSLTSLFDGGSSDGDSSANGVIYYALNKATTPSVAEFSVLVGNEPFTGSASNFTVGLGSVGYRINDTTQTGLTIMTNAPKPFNFTTYFLTANTWSRFKIASQSQLQGKGYTVASTNGWNISTVLTTAGLGTNYDVVYYEGTTWKVFIRTDWTGSSLQYVNNTNQYDYHVNTTQSAWFIL